MIDPESAFTDCHEPKCCTTCGAELDWENCWSCAGDGGFHDCGDDCCPCLEPEMDLNEPCDICHGRGGYLVCPHLPHERSAAR